MDGKLASYLVLGHIPYFRSRHFALLTAKFGGVEAVVAAGRKGKLRLDGLSDTMKDALAEGLPELEPERLKERLDELRITPVHIEDEAYPDRLREIANPPIILFCRGKVELLVKMSIAIVGSRKTSSYGLRIAEKFGYELAELGIVHVSGMALGIDGASHRGALQARGVTVGVLASGVDVVFPGEHRELQEQIASEGLIVSEYPPGVPPKGLHFIERNRIISGLSHGVIVVEAPQKSGALITAEFALEQGRGVFAVPGLASSPHSAGCNHLIKKGQAALVESIDDVISELNISKQALLFGEDAAELPKAHAGEGDSGEVSKAAALGKLDTPSYTPGALDESERELLDLVSYEGTHINMLARKTGLSIAELSARLTMLEIKGALAKSGGGHYQRI